MITVATTSNTHSTEARASTRRHWVRNRADGGSSTRGLRSPLRRPQHHLRHDGHDGPQRQADGDPSVGERPVALAHGHQHHPEHRHQKQDAADPVDPRPVVAAHRFGAGPARLRAQA